MSVKNWTQIGSETQARFLEDGQKLHDFMCYHDVISSAPPRWTAALLESGISAARGRRPIPEHIASYPQEWVGLLQNVIDAYDIEGKDVAVVGSLRPWIECICLARGAKSVTTIDYNPPVLEGATCPVNLRSIHVDDQDMNKYKYDVIMSYSSIEHSGLGRYGDPIDPDGDLKTMRDVFPLMLKSDGARLLFLGVPVSADVLEFNAHRIYGPRRLPRLMEGWSWLQTFVTEQAGKEGLFADRGREYIQPWMVLRIL